MQRTSHCLSIARWTVALLLAALPLLAGASVVRCRAADGSISYQDRSCPSDARSEAVDATPNQGFRFATKQQVENAMRLPPDEPPPRARSSKAKVHKVVNAGERRFIRTGMSAAEVRRRIGAPDHIENHSTSSTNRPSRDARRQWVYLPADDDPQTTTTLTVKTGMVLHVDRKITR